MPDVHDVPDFRELSLAAPLKPRRPLERLTWTPPPFPRAQPRGPIEAYWCAAGWAARWGDFRELSLAAPLKLVDGLSG